MQPRPEGSDLSSSDPTKAHAGSASQRPLWPALRRGYARKCPCCGEGALFDGYLKLSDTCPVCHQDLSHARADDGPAYLTILIVGHLMIPFLHISFTMWRPEPMVMFAVFSLLCVTLSLYLLPRLKGAIVAFQWAREMHGFASDPASSEP